MRGLLGGLAGGLLGGYMWLPIPSKSRPIWTYRDPLEQSTTQQPDIRAAWLRQFQYRSIGLGETILVAYRRPMLPPQRFISPPATSHKSWQPGTSIAVKPRSAQKSQPVTIDAGKSLWTSSMNCLCYTKESICPHLASTNLRNI